MAVITQPPQHLLHTWRAKASRQPPPTGYIHDGGRPVISPCLPSKLSVQAHIQQILHFPPAVGQRMAEGDLPFAPRPSLSGDWRIEYPVTPQPGHPIKISIICGDLA